MDFENQRAVPPNGGSGLLPEARLMLSESEILLNLARTVREMIRKDSPTTEGRCHEAREKIPEDLTSIQRETFANLRVLGKTLTEICEVLNG